MINIGANGREISYGIKYFFVDTMEDLNKILRINSITPGSIAKVFELDKEFILNNNYEWVEKVCNNGGGGNIPNPPPGDTKFDGGCID